MCVSALSESNAHLLWVDIQQVSVVGVDGVRWKQEPEVGIVCLPHFEQHLHLAAVQAHKAGGLQDDLQNDTQKLDSGVGLEMQ